MYSISSQSVEDFPDLEITWRDLESRAKPSVFLSWSWIKHMLNLEQCGLKVLCVETEEKVIGLCLFCIRETRIFNLLTIKQSYINRYGTEDLDQIWIEYNDFLVDASQGLTIKKAMLEYFFVNNLADEVILGMSDTQSARDLSATLPEIKTRSIIQSFGYLTDLHNCESLEHYLDTLSKNTRAQIKRSYKLLRQSGQLELHEATTISEKLDFFRCAGERHRQRWANTEFGTGFNNPKFVKFHEALIADPHQQHATRLFKLSLDTNELGYIYILTQENKWLFYLSALNFHHDNRIKLGLVFHCFIIEQAIKNKVLCYDFLAGNARYKQSLSNKALYEQDLICFYKKTVVLNLINLMRDVKSKLKTAFATFNNKITHIQNES